MKLEDLQLQAKDVKRFWSKVDRTPGFGPEGQCWFWTGTLKEKHRKGGGYGMFALCQNGVKRRPYAHVLSFLLAGGEIPRGEQVLHRCDESRCVNPEHLRAGTQLENIDDAFARSRIQRSRIVDSGVILKVRRLALARGFQNWRELQERTGLSEGTVEGIWSNKTVFVNIGALGRIAEALQVEPGDLIGRVG